jgi:hypothetical protein
MRWIRARCCDGWFAGAASCEDRVGKAAGEQARARSRRRPPLRSGCPVLLARRGRLRPSPSHGRHDAGASRLCSELDMLAVAPPLGRRRDAPQRARPPAALREPPWPAIGMPRSCRQSRGWVCAGSDICGAEERSARGRARSAQRVLTRRDCPSAANEVSVASFATGHETEYRRGVGAKRRPPHPSAGAYPPAALHARASPRLPVRQFTWRC